MARDVKPNLSTKIEAWSRYIGLVSAVVSVLTSLLGNPVVAYVSLAVLSVIVAEHCVRVIFQKSPMQQAYQVLLPSSVTGRGELVYRYPHAQRRKAIIWLTGLTLLLLGVGSFNLQQALAPPVTPAQEGETLILIVQFQSSVSAEPKHDIAQLIYDDLAEAFGGNAAIQPKKIDNIVIESSEAARKLGRATNAALVIWGKFDEAFVYPRYEVIKDSDQITQLYPGHTPLQKESLHLEFTLGTEITQGMVYLANFTIGQSYYLAREYGDALEYFHAAFETLQESDVLDLEPSETLDWGVEYAYFYRGNTFANLGLQSMAIRDYKLAIEKNPRFAEAYNNLGVIWFMRDDYEMALENYELAIDESEELAVAYYNRGILFYNQGNYAAAISDFSEAIDAEHLPLFYQVRADAYFCSHEYELARDDLTTAIELTNDDPERQVRALTERGVVQNKLGEYEKALKDFEQALRLDPDFALANYNMAATETIMGEAEAAIEALKMAIQLNKDLETAAACDPDFDGIRDHPRMPALSLPPEGCEPVVCP